MRDYSIVQMANLLQSCALSRKDLDGYGPPGGYQVYNDGMHMDGIPLDPEMQDEYVHGMPYNSMARTYHDNY